MKLLVPSDKYQETIKTLETIVQRIKQGQIAMTLAEHLFIQDIQIEIEPIDIRTNTIITGTWEPAKTARSHCKKCRKQIPEGAQRLYAKYTDSVLQVVYHVFFCETCGKDLSASQKAVVLGARRLIRCDKEG